MNTYIYIILITLSTLQIKAANSGDIYTITHTKNGDYLDVNFAANIANLRSAAHNAAQNEYLIHTMSVTLYFGDRQHHAADYSFGDAITSEGYIDVSHYYDLSDIAYISESTYEVNPVLTIDFLSDEGTYSVSQNYSISYTVSNTNITGITSSLIIFGEKSIYPPISTIFFGYNINSSEYHSNLSYSLKVIGTSYSESGHISVFNNNVTIDKAFQLGSEIINRTVEFNLYQNNYLIDTQRSIIAMDNNNTNSDDDYNLKDYLPSLKAVQINSYIENDTQHLVMQLNNTDWESMQASLKDPEHDLKYMVKRRIVGVTQYEDIYSHSPDYTMQSDFRGGIITQYPPFGETYIYEYMLRIWQIDTNKIEYVTVKHVVYPEYYYLAEREIDAEGEDDIITDLFVDASCSYLRMKNINDPIDDMSYMKNMIFKDYKLSHDIGPNYEAKEREIEVKIFNPSLPVEVRSIEDNETKNYRKLIFKQATLSRDQSYSDDIQVPIPGITSNPNTDYYAIPNNHDQDYKTYFSSAKTLPLSFISGNPQYTGTEYIDIIARDLEYTAGSWTHSKINKVGVQIEIWNGCITTNRYGDRESLHALHKTDNTPRIAVYVSKRDDYAISCDIEDTNQFPRFIKGCSYIVSANKSITLKPGVHIPSGTDAQFKIGYCLNNTHRKTVVVSSNSKTTTFEASPENYINTNTNEVESDTNIRLYPNPAVDYISINNIQDYKVIEVFNSPGELFEYINLNGEKQVSINVSQYPTGIYILKISAEGDKFESYKFAVE